MFQSLESRVLFSGETGLRADYFNAPTDLFNAHSAAVAALPTVTETDPTVNFDWGTSAPAAGVNSKGFEVRWSGQVLSEAAGTYVFNVESSALVRLWVNGQEIINDWTPQSQGNDVGIPITLAANTLYNIRLDFYQPSASNNNSVSLQWTPPGGTQQVIPQSNLYPFSQATAITSGGIYVGSWESTDPSVVTIEDSTAQPVTIADSIIRGSGILISDTLAGVQLSVQNSAAYGLNPEEAGVQKGSFIYLMSPASVDVEHNSIIGVGGLGIKVYGFIGTGSQTIKIDYNDITDSDGRFSNGDGGYEDDGIMAHTIQIANVNNLAGIDIGWNYIINNPGESYVNDVINLFDTSGTAASPINVHDNYIQGLYDLDPATVWDSGSGITTDGDANLSDEPAYIDIYDNTLVATGSAGIGVPTGHNILVFDNNLVCSGYLPDGSEFFASGCGIYINDLSGGDSSTFFDNGAFDNVVGWIEPPYSQQNGLDEARASDYQLPDADPALTYGNVDLSGVIDSATEAATGVEWIADQDAHGVTVGAVNLLQYFIASQPGTPIPAEDLVGAAVQALPTTVTPSIVLPTPMVLTTIVAPPVALPTPMVLTTITTTTAEPVQTAPPVEPTGVSGTPTFIFMNWNAPAATTYAATTMTIPVPGSIAPFQFHKRKDSRFFADRCWDEIWAA
jgi:hypothetical protein